MDKKVGILVTSRNNYDFLESCWFKKSGLLESGFDVLNLDAGSEEEEIERGRKACEENGVHFVVRDKPGLQNEMKVACEFFKERGVEWFVWFQHDCWFLNPGDISKINNLIVDGKLSQFGTIGFNVLATDICKNYNKGMRQIKNGEFYLGILGRCPLQNKAWQIGGSEAFQKPFSIESAAWLAIGLNVDLFLDTIEPDSGYGFHIAWDDVCFQFLKQNIHNICLPSIYAIHKPELKVEFGIPKCSAKYTRKPENVLYYEQADHMNHWREKWGFEWGGKTRETFNVEQYDGTLLADFYRHANKKTPLMSFNL